MKNTKNIFKKILMLLCAFALFVPMAFGLAACDGTSSGNSSGKLNSGDELTNDRRLFWGSIVAGIDYLNNDKYDAKNIAASLLSASAGDVATAPNDNYFSGVGAAYKFKRTISISHIDIVSEKQTSTEVYEFYYNIDKKGESSSLSSEFDSYEKSITYKYSGAVDDGTNQYNFTATRVVGSNGKVTNESTIEIKKDKYEDKSFCVTGTYATGLTFKDGKSENTTLATITIGDTANEIEQVTIGGVTYKNVKVADSTLGTSQLTYNFCYKENNEDKKSGCTLNVYPSVTKTGDAS